MKNQNYKLGFYINDIPVIERIFPADVYNQETRNNLDLRKEIWNIISDLRKILTTEPNKLTYEHFGYSTERRIYYKTFQSNRRNDQVNDYFNLPANLNHKPKKDDTEKEKKKREEYNSIFQIIFHIGDSVIVKRNFNIYGFKARTLQSVELVEFINNWTEIIKDKISEKDRIQMFTEYSLIHDKGMSLDVIRGMDQKQKERILNR